MPFKISLEKDAIILKLHELLPTALDDEEWFGFQTPELPCTSMQLVPLWVPAEQLARDRALTTSSHLHFLHCSRLCKVHTAAGAACLLLGAAYLLLSGGDEVDTSEDSWDKAASAFESPSAASSTAAVAAEVPPEARRLVQRGVMGCLTAHTAQLDWPALHTSPPLRRCGYLHVHGTPFFCRRQQEGW